MARSPFHPAYAEFIAGVVEARRAAGLTQVQLAERLSKPQSWVSKIERLERRLDVLEFCDVARALGLRPAALMQRIERKLSP